MAGRLVLHNPPLHALGTVATVDDVDPFAVEVLVVVAGGGMAVRSKLKGPGKPTTVRIEKAQNGELLEFVSAPG